jgi:subtilisin family serine protease
MERVLKVFVEGDDQERLAEKANVIERYDAFVLAEAPPAAAKRIARQYLTEDITDQYQLPVATPRGAPDLPRGKHHYLVQFIGPIKESWLRGVRRAGGEPRQLWSGFTYVVRTDVKGIEKIAGLRYVRWTAHLPYEERLATSVREELGRGQPQQLPRTQLLPNVYTVEFFGNKDVAPAAPKVRRLGLKILVEDPKARILVVQASDGKAERSSQLRELAKVHAVRRVRPRAIKRPSNDVAAGVMSTAAALAPRPGLGLSGSGETIGICDTGLDTGDPQTIHPDFKGRVKWIKSYPMGPDLNQFVTNPGGDDGPADLDSGHGTHTSGSILSSGVSSAGLADTAGPIRGLAYKARLAFQAVEQECKWKNPADLQRFGRFLLVGIPSDLAVLFGDSYAKGARIHSNSWGGGDPGSYDDQCRQLDQFVCDHKDFCVVVAAGNDGTDSDGDGKINPMSVSSPGTAKNCITVGACENNRPSFDAEHYGDWWPRDFPVAPFKAQPMADNPDDVVAFSSRGPTKDGRFKPEVIAPGTFVLSTRSRMIAPNNTAWAPFPESKLYFFMGGTSMATPLTSGAVAVVREYLRKKQKIRRPSAALLKAAMVAGATRVPSGVQGAIVDNDQGYGRVDVDAIVAPQEPASVEFIDVTPGVQTGQQDSRKLTVQSSGVPLRIALTWSDAPGPTIVNNLNLIVTAPDGTKHVGNQPAGGTSFDTANNVEVVHVDSPESGDWTVDVVGSNVPQGPQDFALVAIGHF